MSSPFDPDDLRRQAERAAAASREATALHDHAMTLGYNVGVGIASEAADRRIHVGPLGKEPDSLNVGDGYPLAIAENEPEAPTVKVVLFTLVIAGAWSIVRVKDCVATGEMPLVAVMVIG